MGIIADHAGERPKSRGYNLPAPGGDKERWNRALGRDKEEGLRQAAQVGTGQPPVPGGSFGRGTYSGQYATQRLIESLRSRAPGGWSDDRYEESRHFTGAPYVAIDRRGKLLQQAEFSVYRKVRNDPEHPDGKIPITPDDPPEGNRLVRPYRLVELLERPNNQDSFGLTMYRWNQQLGLTGMALTFMVPGKLGYPCELYSIPTAIAIPQPAVNPDFPNGFWRIQPLYPYGPFSSYPTPNTAVGAPIPSEWMMRFMYPHPLLRYDGYSPLTGVRSHVDQLEAIDRSRFYTMRRSLRPSAVLNGDTAAAGQIGPMPEAELDRIHAEFENDFQSPENAGRLIVTTGGFKLEPWGERAIDMDYPAGWEQILSFILGGGFGITKPAAGMIEDSSYSVLYATLKQLNLISLQPDCDSIGSELTHQLGPFFGDDLVIEIRCRRIDDHEVIFAALDKLVMGKAITKNELREKLSKIIDIASTKEKWGDEIAGFGADTPAEEMAQPPLPGQEGGLPVTPIGPKAPEEPVDEAERARPSTNTLGRGSLGPRMKHLNGRAKKSTLNGRK